jgi:hypothetical protein
MSAKLLKSLADGKCLVANRISGEVVIYWPTETGSQSIVIKPDRKAVNLLEFANITQLRKSPNLKKLVNDGSLSVL